MFKKILIILICFSLAGCNPFWRKYENKEYKFSLIVPSSWEDEEGIDKTAVIIKSPLRGNADRYSENVTVVVNELPAEIPLLTIFEMNKEEFQKSLAGIYDIDEGDIFAGFVPGKWLSFNSKIKEINLKIISAVWVKGKKVYSVTCVGQLEEYPRYQRAFDKILHSLRIR